ncbi:MAG TPA: sulfotransferase [Pirellulales bacterium]|nr:sulfotransferase [Pirellulales bacterium]
MPESRATNDESPFEVPIWRDFLGSLVHRHPKFFLRLASLETNAVAKELQAVSVAMPIYVCGLARSGSTLLHEIVASHPSVATHRIKDFPLVFTPYWWRRAIAKRRPSDARERAHRDRMMITSESPDALEEMIWMAFFRQCHDPSVTNVIGANERHSAFESFYTTHVRKLLLAERATRYAAKANYHVARLAYLVRLFPDAKFLLPVRAPADHVASLMRQHERFSQGQRKHPRALAFMQRSGHFEFGLDRRPINLGDNSRVEEIVNDWDNGHEVRGLARYWNMVYAYLADLLAADEQVRAATLVVRYETLCDAPAETLTAVLNHVALPDNPGPDGQGIVERYASTIRRPDYYTSKLTDSDRAIIEDATAATAALWGYTAD